MDLVVPKKEGVFLIFSSPLVRILYTLIRTEIASENIKADSDFPVDSIVVNEISRYAEELIFNFIDDILVKNVFDSIYGVTIDSILNELSYYVHVFNINGISFYSGEDALLISCKRLENMLTD